VASDGAPAVEIVGAAAGYGGRIVLEGLTLRVAAGELVGIVGPSGSGKSTLLRLLTGGAERFSGLVEVCGEPVGSEPPRRIGYVPQLASGDRHFPLTVEQFALLGLAARSSRRPWFSTAERAVVARLLERLGLASQAKRRFGELSGGQQQRALLARAMVGDPALLLLDEPTSGVDLSLRAEMLKLLGELNREGLTIVLTTHDLNWVAAQLPRIVCLHGRVIADGHPSQILTPEVLAATFAASVRIVRDGDLIMIADASPLLVP
jgi:ABC-type Mn2+/Zn2+ transport system ATPase subunit